MLRPTLTLVTAPTAEPITLAEAKLHLKVDVTDDNDLVTYLIKAVRERCELSTGRAIVTQTWDWVHDAFPDDDYLEIPKPPLQSVTSLKYVDSAGTEQTWAATNYIVTEETATPPVLNPRQPRGRLGLAYGKAWPSTYGQIGDVTIRFVCGYGADSAVPLLLKAGMLLDLGTLYRYRTNVVSGDSVLPTTLPGGVEAIYRSYRSHATQRLVAA